MDRKLTAREYVFLSSMLFGLFFGAGNLIFPVHMGQQAGSAVWPAVAGFCLTGVGLPLLGIAAMGISRSDGLFELGCLVGKKYSYFFTCLLYLTIGPLFAIPRTATVSFNVGLLPLLPQEHARLALCVFSALFFLVVLYFSLRPSGILTWVGKILNPLFLLFLGILTVTALLRPMGAVNASEPVGNYAAMSFFQGFLDGYNTMDALAGLDRKIVTFGLTDEADVTAKNIRFSGARSTFDIYVHGRLFTDVTLHVPGIHNVRNALAATAAMLQLDITPTAVKYGLAGFNGAGRRFEYKGKYNGADVYDDYAHHPGELKATIDAVEQLGYKRTIVVFQPHTYSRTAALFDDFVEQLKRPDVTYLAEIYAAREQNTIGISSRDIAVKINGAKFFPTFDEIVADLKKYAQPGDIILTIGAGDVYKIGERLVEQA